MSCSHVIEYGELTKLLDKGTEKMVGEILTILEASIPGDRQVEAAKTAVKKIIWNFNREMKSLVGEKTMTEENK